MTWGGNNKCLLVFCSTLSCCVCLQGLLLQVWLLWVLCFWAVHHLHPQRDFLSHPSFFSEMKCLILLSASVLIADNYCSRWFGWYCWYLVPWGHCACACENTGISKVDASLSLFYCWLAEKNSSCTTNCNLKFISKGPIYAVKAPAACVQRSG